MAARTVTAKKSTAPTKAAKKITDAKKAATSGGGGVDYRTARAERQDALTDEQRQAYEQAYFDAGRAMDLAELIYTARTEASLTQTQLAVAMRTSQSAVAAWENGARIPGIDALERIAAACGKRLHITITAA